jgi:hypothetical protein
MKNSNVPQRNTVSNEVKVDLDVFGALVLDGIRGHVHSAHIVAKDNSGTMKWAMKLLEELAKPTCFGDGVGDSPILRFSTRARHRVLTLGRPRDQVVAEEGAVPRGGAPGVWTASPVRVGVGDEAVRRGRRELETVTKRALDVPKNSFDQSQVLIPRVVNVKTNLLHGVGDVRTSECQVLKSTRQAVVGGGIGDRTTSLGCKLRRGVHRRGRGVAGAHAGTLENLESVLDLGEKHPLGISSDGKAEEVMKLAQIGHGELSTEGGDHALE